MRVMVDMTETVVRGLNTGVQRVVRNTVLRADRVAADVAVELVPVVAVGAWFYAVQDVAAAVALPAASAPLSAPAAARLPRVRRALRSLLARLPGGAPVQRFWHSWRRWWHLRPLGLRRCIWRPDDVLLLLDSYWSGDETLRAARVARREGARVVTVVYDLIPLTHPQFCSASAVSRFRQDIGTALDLADAVLAISAAVAADTRAFAPTAIPDWASRCCPVDHFRLGSDLRPQAALARPESTWDGWPRNLWGDRPVFLMVGSLEPHKGHLVVLEAFERRWRRGAREVLLILGKPGWNMGPWAQRLRGSSYLGQCLFVLHTAPDTAVAEAIRRSYAGIVASAVEGFGLPLVEFMKMGLPVLASDIAVFRETGGDGPLYFRHDEPDSISQAVDRLAAEEQHVRARVAAFRWPDWDEAVDGLLRKVVTVAQTDEDG